MFSSNLFLFSLLISIFSIPIISHTPPTYIIDLDEPAELRWKQVASHYGDQIKLIVSQALKQFDFPTALLDILRTQAPAILAYLPKDYGQEIVGISRITGVPLSELILVNILYDMIASCTSIVAETKDSKIIHARNLDFLLAAELKNLTIIVVMKKGGAILFISVSYAGMVGVLTGQKPHSFSVSINERDKGYAWENLYEILLNREAHFVTFEIRRVLEMPGLDYAGALNELMYSVLMAPCYIILGGVKSGEGAVITRARESAVSARFLDTAKGTWYVLETNYDWWNPPPSHDDRRDPAIEHMDRVGRGNVSLSALYEVLSAPPVCNPGTTYTALMSAGDPSAFAAVVRDLDTPCDRA